MHKLFLSWRYLRKRRIAIFGTLAVALCVALLIIVTSLFSGFINRFERSTTDIFGQVIINADSLTLADYRQLQSQLLASDKIDQVKINLESAGLLYLGRGNAVGVRIVGLDSQGLQANDAFVHGLLNKTSANEVFTFSPTLQKNAKAWLEKRNDNVDDLPVPLIAGIGVVAIADEITDEYNYPEILSQLENRSEPVFITSGNIATNADGSLQANRRQLRCWPVNIVELGDYNQDNNTVYVPIETVADIVGRPQSNGQVYLDATVQISSFATGDTDEILAISQAIWNNFLRHRYAIDINRQTTDYYVRATASLPHIQRFTAELRKQMAVLQSIVGLICAVTALLVLVILMMIVMQKRKDIGIMRAIGASKMSIAGVFVNFGAGIGIAGSILGVALGYWATININILEQFLSNLIGAKIWKSGVYMFSQIPNEVAWPAVWWIVIVGIITAIVGSALPALKAAAVHPVETLRYE